MKTNESSAEHVNKDAYLSLTATLSKISFIQSEASQNLFDINDKSNKKLLFTIVFELKHICTQFAKIQTVAMIYFTNILAVSMAMTSDLNLSFSFADTKEFIYEKYTISCNIVASFTHCA